MNRSQAVTIFTRYDRILRLFLTVVVLLIPLYAISLASDWWLLDPEGHGNLTIYNADKEFGESSEFLSTLTIDRIDLNNQRLYVTFRLAYLGLPPGYTAVEILVVGVGIRDDQRKFSLLVPSPHRITYSTLLVEATEEDQYLPITSYGSFPFDLHEVEVYFWIEANYIKSDATIVHKTFPLFPELQVPPTNLNLESPDESGIFSSKEIRVSEADPSQSGNDVEVGKIHFNLSQPYIYRIVTPVIILMLFMFSVLVYSIDKLSNVLEVAVGILFGSWGVRQVLLPTELPFRLTSTFDFLLVLVYVALGVALAMWALKNYWLQSTRPIRSYLEAPAGDLNPLADQNVLPTNQQSSIPPTTDNRIRSNKRSQYAIFTVLLISISVLIGLFQRYARR